MCFPTKQHYIHSSTRTRTNTYPHIHAHARVRTRRRSLSPDTITGSAISETGMYPATRISSPDHSLLVPKHPGHQYQVTSLSDFHVLGA